MVAPHIIPEIFFHDARFFMTRTGRFFVRLVVYVWYVCAGAFIVTALLSDVVSVRWVAVCITLILVDRAIHAGRAERDLIFLRSPKKVNVALYCSPRVVRIILSAYDEACSTKANFYLVVLDHLLRDRNMTYAFSKIDVHMKELRAKLTEYIYRSSENNMSSCDGVFHDVAHLACQAFESARSLDMRWVETPDVLSALGKVQNPDLQKLFDIFEITNDSLHNIAILARFTSMTSIIGSMNRLGGFAHRPRKIRHRVMNRAWTARPTPTLDTYGEDITDLARAGVVGFMIGHAQEYERMVDVLSKGVNPNVLLVGDPGAGKHTLVAHLAFRISKDKVPSSLFDKRVISVSLGSLLAGADQGGLADRLKRILHEVAIAENIILYIPDIHNLVRTSGRHEINASDILLPAIKGTTFSVIGGTYPREFREYIRPNSDFASAFDIIEVQEVSEDDATKVLVYESILLERDYRLNIHFSAIHSAVQLAHKYFRATLLPASARSLLKEAVAEAHTQGKKIVIAEDIVAIAEKKVNIPLRTINENSAEELLHLEDTIHERFINQDDAVKAVARALREYRSGLSRRGGPIATFLFVGPTGVGKTELSKILARLQFGSSDFLARFDMSEYQEKQSISRLIGSSDGSTSGILTDAVHEKPYSLILLDEFEKAHPDLLNLFLQVFDDGRLTDALGRVVDFQNTIIIATSNAHSEFIKQEIEAGKDALIIAESLKKKLTDYFKPELINRFSNIIVFRSLSREHVSKITRLLLDDVGRALQESHAVSLMFTDDAVERIADLGYDPVFGARPLRNVISERVRSVLAEKILKKEIGRGDTITISARDGELAIENIARDQ